MSVERFDSLLAKFEKLPDLPVDALYNSVAQQIERVKAEAKIMCVVSDGELRNSIHSVVEKTNGSIFGICYTNKSYAPYVEFGTGPVGEKNHNGISPTVNPVYSQSPWWIHESQIGKEIAERYRWKSIDTKDGVFYLCHGQPARPFLYPALKNLEQSITSKIGSDLKEEMKKI